jgi:5-methylthioadenosine/S-adenosylhomocysteine deaminase
LRGWAEGVNLQGFLERVWAAEGAIMDEATCELGTELGALEALLSGTTTTMDMYLNPAATHRGAVRVGLRHIAGPIFFDFPGLDGLQWEQRIERAHQWPAELAKIGGPFIPTYLMPHSTYTDSPENLRQVAAIAKELGARIHLHVSETEAENADVQSRYSKSPTEVCRDTGILDVPTIFGHGVHLSDTDMAIAASKGTSVGHCPGSNLKLGSGLARFNDLRKAGIAVGLGTDSCSSSNDLDMFSVMRMAAHVVALRQSPADVDLTAIVRAATIEAAMAVGLDDRIGSIEIGKEADLIALDLHAAHLTPVHDVNALLVFAAGRGDVTDVWVAGEKVVENRVSTKVDLTDLIKRVNQRVKALEPLK